MNNLGKLTPALFLVACATTPPPAPVPSGQPTGDPIETPAASALTVTCAFNDGWVAVVPRSVFKQEDGYTMQALIGFAEDPGFWGGQADYAALAPYAARKCGGDPIVFAGAGADSVVLVGKANTFNGDKYGINGVILDVPAAGTLALADQDLTMTWPCISCPRLYAWTGTGWELRGEVLVDVIGAGAERTQRRAIGKVVVAAGQVRLRLAEEEDEVSHVDALTLEVGGLTAVPAVGALDTVDGARTILHRGDAIELRYDVALPDGEYDAVAVATGYYLPLAGVSAR